MSKLNEILTGEMAALLQERDVYISKGDAVWSTRRLKADIKTLVLELIGDVEERETEDMSLNSWTPDDYKAFGKNELKVELRRKIEEL